MIQLEDIKIQFGEKALISGFNLSAAPGEKILLSGPSGRGKSSILKAVLGFVPISSGEIYIDGILNEEKSICNNRARIAYVSQDVDLMPMNGREFIEEVYTYRQNRHLKYDTELIQEQLDFFELSEDILQKNITNLSGGERQRLGLVIAFLLDRDILLLDEVTSALDKHLKEKVVERILSSHKTVITISHDDIWLNRRVRVASI